MDVIVRGHDMKVTDAIQEFAQDKIGKLDRYLPNITEIKVDLSRQRTRRGEGITIAQITLRHSRGAILRAEEKVYSNERDSVKIAITTAVDKMYRQIERFKGKKRKKGRRDQQWERYYATAEELSIAEEVPNYEEIAAEFEVAQGGENVIRHKEIALTAMNEQEAIEQMELLSHTFFMFQNADTGAVNVLYRREDGGYGVLVPQ
jgi:putative sigma-54 modulation protein